LNLFFDKIAYQALPARGYQKYHLEIKIPENAELLFSIFNAWKPEMEFSIILVQDKKKKWRKIYSNKISDGISSQQRIDFSWLAGKKVELIFITKGNGFGAWVDPSLIRKKKNPRTVIIVSLDTLRRDHLSLYGYHRDTDPFLRELAKESVKFENAFSTSSWTLPAHASLFSGLDCTEHELVHHGHSEFSSSIPLIQAVFQKEGFATLALTGGGYVAHDFGFKRGFQLYSDCEGLDVGGRYVLNHPEILMKQLKNHLSNLASEDLFIFLHTYQIHGPYKAPMPYRTKFNKGLLERNYLEVKDFIKSGDNRFCDLNKDQKELLIALYDASINYCDQELLKPLVSFLKAKNRWENTFLLILADHGEEFYDHSSWEHGHTLYDELVRIPLVVRYPKSKNGGTTNTAVISIKDVWKLIFKEMKLEAKYSYWKNLFYKKSDYFEMALPETTLKHIPTRVSFLNEGHRYIHNFLDSYEPEFFHNAPVIEKDELFELTDEKNLRNLANKKHYIVRKFKKNFLIYLDRLKKIKKQNSVLQDDLKKQLEALGYLNN
jgi:hypothetical protein